MNDIIGKMLRGKYQVRKRLGKSGMSCVYLVKDLKLNVFRALKIVDKKLKDKGLDPSTEVEIMKMIKHPNLVQVIDIFEDEDYYFIVMELIAGTTLDTVIKSNKKIEESKVIKWSKQICNTLDYLHNSLDVKIIHKDLKPSNIMVSPDGEKITLIDFGISQILEKNKYIKNIPVGTKGYAAPEQFKQDKIDESADIYSFGVTLYNLLTGMGPKLFDDGFIPLRKIDDTLSEGIQYISYKCIQEDKANRYSNINEVLRDLEDINNIGVEYKKELSSKRKKRIGYLSAAVCCMCIIGLGVNIVNKANENIDRFDYLVDKARYYIQEDDFENARINFDDARLLESDSYKIDCKIVENYIDLANTMDVEIRSERVTVINEAIDYIEEIKQKNSSDNRYNYLLGKLYLSLMCEDNLNISEKNYTYAYNYLKEVDEGVEEEEYKFLKDISEELYNYGTYNEISINNLKNNLDQFELYIDSLDPEKIETKNLYNILINIYSIYRVTIIKETDNGKKRGLPKEYYDIYENIYDIMIKKINKVNQIYGSSYGEYSKLYIF